jgi:hypothetical protein
MDASCYHFPRALGKEEDKEEESRKNLLFSFVGFSLPSPLHRKTEVMDQTFIRRSIDHFSCDRI